MTKFLKNRPYTETAENGQRKNVIELIVNLYLICMTLYFIATSILRDVKREYPKETNENFELPYIMVAETSRVTLTICDNNLTHRDLQTRPYCDSRRDHHSATRDFGNYSRDRFIWQVGTRFSQRLPHPLVTVGRNNVNRITDFSCRTRAKRGMRWKVQFARFLPRREMIDAQRTKRNNEKYYSARCILRLSYISRSFLLSADFLYL